MGALIFPPELLADTLSETVGYKAGIALSVGHMCDIVGETDHVELLRGSEDTWVRIRAEDYEDLFYRLLHGVGYTDELYDGDYTGVALYHKYMNTAPEVEAGVTELYAKMLPELVEVASKIDSKKLDPTPFIRAAAERYGRLGAQIAFEHLQRLDAYLSNSPWSSARYKEWTDVRPLADLFEGSAAAPAYGEFFDQRFIDFLEQNPSLLQKMHWRKFEELTAEYFARQGFRVQLGTGSNDDGVDVRLWWPGDQSSNPHAIVQCKRQKDKIEKVVVKGLMSDVAFEKADIGLIVTSSELSPGARKTIDIRSYPIREINRTSVEKWLRDLRTPGTGIVRT